MDAFYELLVNEMPTFIATKNSYERYQLYQALEKYGIEHDRIWFNRKKEYINMYATGYRCKKHKEPLSRCDDYEGDFWCDECAHYKYRLYERGITDYFDNCCMYLAEPGDFLWKSRVTVGLNIYYTKPKFKVNTKPVII